MFTGINMFWAKILLVLTQATRQKSKRTLRRVQNLFTLKNINSIQLLQQNAPKIHEEFALVWDIELAFKHLTSLNWVRFDFPKDSPSNHWA